MDIIVNAGGDLQTALDSAVGGDRVLLQSGALFNGSYRCKSKGNTQDIVITTNIAASSLPAPGYRVTPSYSGVLARLRAPTGGLPALKFDRESSHWKVIGIEFEPNPNGYNDIVQVGNNSDGGVPYVSYDDYQLYAYQPTDIELDRILVRGDVFKGQKRGIYLNGRNLSVINSWVDTIFGVGQDAQAIACLNGDGPYRIENCYLEGAAETFLTGGADPAAYTSAQIAASPAPTVNSATLTAFRIGNNNTQHSILSQGPLIGKRIAIRITSTSVHHAIVQTQVGDSITWSPDAPAVPLSGSGSDVRWGANVNLLTFRRNYLFKRLSWKDAFLATPGNFQGVGNYSSGSLAAGNYYFRVQAVNPAGYNQQEYISDAAAQITVNLTQTGQANLSWNSVTNASKYRIWGYANNAPDRFWETTATSISIQSLSGTLRSFNGTGTRPVVKTHFELKTGTNVVAEDCIAENHWFGSADGHPLWLKAVNQEGKAPFAETSAVTMQNWKFKNSEGNVLFSGQEFYTGNNRDKPVRMGDTTLRNILFEGSTRARVLHLVNMPNPLTVDHCTFLATTTSEIASVYFLDQINAQVNIRNSLFRRMFYGVLTPGYAEGTASLNAITAAGGGYQFAKNAVADAPSGNYPADNFYPTEANWQAAFVNYNGGSGGNYRIAAGHAYENAGTDGKDLGCDIDELEAAIAGVVEGVPESAGGEVVGGTMIRLTSAQAYTPTLSYATFRMRGSHRVIFFEDGATEVAYFYAFMPRYFAATHSLRFTIWGVADSVTGTQRAKLEVGVERITPGQSIGSDNFTINEPVEWAPPSTSGQPASATFVITASALATAGIVGGDMLRLRVRRIGGDAGDTLVGGFYFTRLEVRKES